MMTLTTLPDLQIQFGGAELSEPLLATLAAIEVNEALGRPAQCELTFIDPPLAEFGQQTIGSELAVVYAATGDEVFAGTATALEVVHDSGGVTSVRVRAYSALNDAGNAQVVRTFEDMTVGEIVETVLSENGIFVEIDCDTTLRHHVTQFNESDLELVNRLLAEEGVLLSSRGLLATVFATDGGLREMEFLELGLNLLEVSIEMNAVRATESVATQSWSPVTGEAEGQEATAGRVVHGLRSEDGAARVLSGVVSNDERHIALAQSELDRRAAVDSIVAGTAEGSATLRPGVVVALEGVAAPFNESYVIATTSHTFDARGYLTSFTSEIPATVAPAPGAVASIGVVSAVDDPEMMGRVQVTYPAFGDIQSPWMLVALPGGSAAAGLTCLPSVGDTVIVLLPDGSPSHGVILGGLAAAPGFDDSGVDGDATMRYLLVTPGGHRVSLDDTAQSIRIDDVTGSFFEMTPDGVTLHAGVDLQIEAPGQNLVIAATAIDFRRL